jgi:hypothetical protein
VAVPHHSADLHILQTDHVILLQQRKRCLVVEGAPLTSTGLMRVLEQRDGRAPPPPAALWATREPTLRPPQRTQEPGERGADCRPPTSQSAVMSNTVSPTLMPVSCPVAGSGSMGTAAQEMSAYHPSASRLMVTVVAVPTSA